MEKPMNVCVLVGSLRKASLNGMLANALMSLAPSSMKLEIVEIGQLPLFNQDGKYPPAEPGALGIGPLEAATLDPKLYLFGRRTKYSLPTSPRPFIQIFLRHFGEQMPLDNCVATWWG